MSTPKLKWLQEDWSFVDLNWEVITEDERLKTIEVVWNLPIQEYIEQIMEVVSKSIVTIIQAETWSGKTTQVPKMLSQAMGYLRKIIVTEPRVIAAIWAARRVSHELMSFTQDEKFSIWHKVWYRTWKEKISSPDSEITFVTDALQLLRQFVSKIIPDILVIDEVHTFSVATEFLLALIKNQMEETKKKIKLVLMSATIDVELLKNYFYDIPSIKRQWVPSLDIHWRTFPVEKHYKKWEDFIPSILELASQNKNVLVFVEWKKAIDTTIWELQQKLPNYNIVPLHSELSSDEQKSILKNPNKPTIVVATNIAQESITLDYINAVVDNWYCKTLKVNPQWVPELIRTPITKAEAMQRAWRAWRVMDGIYIWANNNNFEDLEDFPAWEIENITLERYILISLAVWFDPMRELKKAWNRKKVFVHNPDKRLLELSYENLKKMWAIDWDSKLTEIWQLLLNFPLNPHIAIMLLNGIKSSCAWNMIEICSILNHNSFIWKWNKWKDFVKWTYRQDSDLIGVAEFFKLVTTKEPLNSELISRLKKYWISESQLKLFEQFSKNGKEKMLFEIVDLSIIWVKSKKIYEILHTVDILKERLVEMNIPTTREDYEQYEGKDHIIKEQIKKSNESLTRNIVRSILSWIMDNIFVWHKKEKKFYNDKMWWFNMPLNTLMKDFSDKCHYVGFPFIIWWNKQDEDSTPLLFFITKVDEWDIIEVKHAYLQETFKDIKFGVKKVGETTRWKVKLAPKIVANMWKDLWWMSLSSINAEIPKENQEDIMSFHWLPDFMIENNLVIKKYLRSFKSRQKFNMSRFKELLTLFIPSLYSRFDLKNRERSLHNFSHDSSVFDAFYNSEDPRVREFKENPYIKKYEDDVIWKRIEEKREASLTIARGELIQAISQVRETSNEQNIQIIEEAEKIADQEEVRELWEKLKQKNWLKTVRKTKSTREQQLLEMRQKIRELKEKAKIDWTPKNVLNNLVREIESWYNYTRSVKKWKNEKVEEKTTEISDEYKIRELIEGLKLEWLKKEEFLKKIEILKFNAKEKGLYNQELFKIIKELKSKYWGKKSKEKVDSIKEQEPISKSGLVTKKTKVPVTKKQQMIQEVNDWKISQNNENLSEEEIDKWIREIEAKYWVYRPKIISLWNDKKIMTEEEMQLKIKELKRISKKRWWTKEKFEALKANIEEIDLDNLQ